MASDYPSPHIVPPRSLPHKQTFILLHGRGSSGDKFGPPLLDTPISSSSSSSSSSASDETTASPPPAESPSTSLAAAFPNARFVFPTAARRRATVYRRSYTHQWFDNWKLDPPATDREELQVPGLRETASYLHELLWAEIDLVPGGASSIVFGGLSQGCAASLAALLLWEGEPLAGAVGMCGWLPFQTRLEEQLSGEQASDAEDGNPGEDSFDPFEREETDEAVLDPPCRAVRWLREEIGCPQSSESPLLSYQGIPIFLGHGVLDDRVSVILGRNASGTLDKLGSRVSWKEYEGLGHWYSEDMLGDMTVFLNRIITS